MKSIFGPLTVGGLAAFAAAVVASNDARACAAFYPSDQSQTTVVTAHRMALSISPSRTVLWDQVQYTGAPSEFAWVVPVKPGARVEVANNAWFEALDAATSTRVTSPQLNCPQAPAEAAGCSCGALGARGGDGATLGFDGNAAPAITVVHQGAVGPYDSVTLHASVPGSLTTWLITNGFAIDPSIQPVIDAYAAEGFDFIALRLKPDKGIQQMTPVRVVSPGAVPALPLRMVGAGTGANVAVTLFVIGEGRWTTKNFPSTTVDPAKLDWDFGAGTSNYAALRADALAASNGRTWITASSRRGSLLSQLEDPTLQGQIAGYTSTADPGGNVVVSGTIGELYVRQGIIEGVTTKAACLDAFPQYAESMDVVVDLCAEAEAGGGGAGGGTPACDTTKQGEIDARAFACDALDDLAVALVGTHPSDVWLTRMESNLPHAALTEDLEIEASSDQTEVQNLVRAATSDDPPCPLAAAPIPSQTSGRGEGPRPPRGLGNLAALAAGLAALGAMLGRRKTRRLRSA